MSRSSSQSTQQVVTTQQTSVNVQNIIEAPKQTPLQKFKDLSEVINLLDKKNEVKEVGGTALIIQNPDPLSFFKDPNNLIMIGAGLLGVILIAKKV